MYLNILPRLMSGNTLPSPEYCFLYGLILSMDFIQAGAELLCPVVKGVLHIPPLGIGLEILTWFSCIIFLPEPLLHVGKYRLERLAVYSLDLYRCMAEIGRTACSTLTCRT